LSAALAFAAILAVAPPAAPAAAAPGSSTGARVMGQVTYRVGGSVYVDLGSLDGLAAGDTLTVVRLEAAVARLVARDVAPRRAACDTLAGGAAIEVGDGAWFMPRAANVAAAVDSSMSPAGMSIAAADSVPAPAVPRLRRGVRGRIGASAWSVDPGREGAYLQPAADVWLDARGLAGGAVDAVLDVRGRSTAPMSGSSVPVETFGARVYRAAATWHDPRSRYLVTLGRQYAPSFAGVSLFDGVVARTAGERWGGGVLFGAQPEVGDLAVSFDLLQAGAFIEAHSTPGNSGRWTAALGGVTSSQEGEVNRDFLFVGGSWQKARAALYLAQEIDIARGWRKDVLPGTFTLSTTFASARFEVTKAVQARAGYDARRSVPLYRDRVTPETEFDDALREGGWLGASVRPLRELRIDADVRRRFGDASQALTAWNGGAEYVVAGARPLRLRARAALSDGEEVSTTLFAGGIECTVARDLSLGAGGGVRTTTDDRAAFTEQAPWWNIDADWAFGGGWSAAGSFEQENGDAGRVQLARLGAAYRF